jgi:protein involved in polysaccharide export with SLBB domain
MVCERSRRSGIVSTTLRALVLFVSVWACLGFATSQAVSQGVADYRLGPGDKIRVTVFGHEDLSGEFEVDGSGNVSLPLIRNVPAQGLTVSQLEQAVIDRLQPDYLKDPSVSVEVLNYRPFYIYGEVNQPGSYPYVSGMTVLNAIAMAGGFTYRAKKSEVQIIRSDDTSKTPLEGGPDTQVLPGDVIEVPERFF